MNARKTTKTKVTIPKDFKPTRAMIASAPKRMPAIIAALDSLYPDAHCELDYQTPLQLLVATILSAQCTDIRVNIVTKTLFKKYRTAADYAHANLAELEQDIKSTGFFRNKARNIQLACQQMIELHKGQVPDNIDALTALPGVGRKTANVILGDGFGVPGITTDTHVIRLSRLLALSPHDNPLKLEQDLMKLVEPQRWTLFSHQIILHGRRVCNARKPACARCPLRPHCPYGLSLPQD